MRSRKLRKIIGFHNDGGGTATVDKEVCVRAARAVFENAKDIQEASLMLEMLGLIPPRTPAMSQKVYKQTVRNEQRRNKLAERGISPEEYGEGEEDAS